MLRQQLLSTVSCYSQFFLSSQGMQGWDVRGEKTAGKWHWKPYFCVKFCSGHTHTHTQYFFFCWFCTLYFERASIFVLDFPAFTATKSRAFMHADSCTHKYLMRPFTHQLCYSLLLYEAITQLPPLWQSSQITSIWIPPLLLPLYLLPFLAHPCSIWPPSPLSLWLRSHSVIIQHRATKKEEKSRDKHSHSEAIHKPSAYLQRGDSGSVSRSNADLHERRSVSVWSVCKTNRWHHGRKAPPASLV